MLKFLGKQRKKKGFTLIELIVVIAILAILAVIAIPRLSGSRDKANRSAVIANLRSIESAITVAEAEGTELNVTTDNVGTGSNLVDKYLAKWPEGPGGATYQIIKQTGDVFRAQVTFADGKLFKFQGVDANRKATLDNLKEPTN